MTVLDFVLLAKTYRDLGPTVVESLEAMMAGWPVPIHDSADIEHLGKWLETAQSLGLKGVDAPKQELATLRGRTCMV